MNEPDDRITHRSLEFRAVLVGLGLVQLFDGLYALLAPRSFYSDFPFGRGWVEVLPAYNEHLTRDVGSLFIATAVILIAAGIYLQRRLVAVALGSWLCFAIPHAIYHLFNLEPYATGDAIANAVSLGLTVVLPLWLLVSLSRGETEERSRAATPSGAGTNARIAGVPEDTRDPIVRAAYRSSRRKTGAVVDPVRLFAHHKTLMTGYGAMEMATERSHLVPERLKHLAELRAAMLAGCEWCLDFGSSVSQEAAVDEEDMRELPLYATSERFSEEERLVLDYATGMSRTPVNVPDELFARLRERFDEAQLVELTSVVALENYRARFNWAMGIESQGFSEGSYCVRPEASSAV